MCCLRLWQQLAARDRREDGAAMVDSIDSGPSTLELRHYQSIDEWTFRFALCDSIQCQTAIHPWFCSHRPRRHRELSESGLQTCHSKCLGFNVNWAEFSSSSKIPTLIVHGENDTKFYSALEALKNIPSSETLIIKNASHACYTQQPLEFHNGLRQFLYNVYRPIYIEQYKSRVLSSTNTSTSVLAAELTENTAKKREKNVTVASHKLWFRRSWNLSVWTDISTCRSVIQW